MRRFVLLLIGFTVVVMVLLLASVAGAIPPGFCDKNPEHLKCDPPSSSTTTTTTVAPPELEACPDQWPIDGKGSTSFECLWQPLDDGSETATVTISDLTGAVEYPPAVFVRDDSPGDICVLEQAWAGHDGPEYVASFDLFYDEVPPGYEAWLDHSYWDLLYTSEYVPGPAIVGAYWCGPQDPVLETIRFDTNGTPLHVLVSFNAKKGGSLVVTLNPGNSL